MAQENNKDEKTQRKLLVGLGDSPKPSGNETPLAVFKSLLNDFSGGIRQLQSIAGRRTENSVSSQIRPEASKTSAPLRAERSHSLREIERTIVKGGVTNATRTVEPGKHSAANSTASSTGASATEKSSVIRHDSKSVTAGSNSSLTKEINKLIERFTTNTKTLAGTGIPQSSVPSGLRARATNRPVVSGADREAHRQINETYRHDSVHHVPAPARLAQILHADALVKRGEGNPSPELHSMAEAVRSGRKREVADLDPEHVQQVLEHALGGQTRSTQILDTPLVKMLTEKHVNMIKTLQSSLREKEVKASKETYREVLQPKAPSAPKSTGGFFGTKSDSVTGFTPASSNNIGSRFDSGRDVSESHSSELISMAATNDAPHLHAAASSAEDKIADSVRCYKNADRVLSNNGVTSNSGSSSSTMIPPTSSYEPKTMAAQGPAPTGGGRAPMNFSSITPSGGASKAMSQVMSESKSDTKKREFTGKMKLTGENGQALGSALMEGEEQ